MLAMDEEGVYRVGARWNHAASPVLDGCERETRSRQPAGRRRYVFRRNGSALWRCCSANIRGSLGNRKLQIPLRIEVANALDKAAEKAGVIGEFAAGNILANEVAEDAAKIFVARIRHERT